MSMHTETSDKALLDFLRKRGAVPISALVAEMGVTATAVRQRLTRLMGAGLVERQAEKLSRGRPNHRYSLTEKGVRASGTNYNDIAVVLWNEIKSVDDPAVRAGLLKRISARLSAMYREEIDGATLRERMSSLVELMAEREIPFEVTDEGELPVLSALACPYPDIAAHDRSVCAMEKMMLSEVLGNPVRLSECRLDGGSCCTFTPSAS